MPDTPDKFHQHEALHMAHALQATWSFFVTNSSYADARPEVKAKCEAALEAMAEAYQAIGQEDM
jgi:TPP-dependent pyruvate/acetoin dehydrogenase alpha subunit